MKFGAHVSTRQPFSEAIARAQDLGCECMQIFGNPPQRWNPIPIDEEEIDKFNKENTRAKINPIVIHGIYLVNLASNNPFFYKASIASLVDDMKKAKEIGAIGVVSHMGSTKGDPINNLMHKVEDAIQQILDQSPKETSFIIENAAGAGNIIGDTLGEIEKLVHCVKSDRVKVLIDTAHAFESGMVDFSCPPCIDDFLNNFDQKIGLDRLVGFHFNDSKTEFNSKRDRHADLGKGKIGLEAFEHMAKSPLLKDKFAILETPEDETSWKEQLKLLKGLR